MSKKEETKTVTLENGGIIKKILKEGEGNETPQNGSRVRVHYVGTLTNGEKFDSSRDRDDPFEFELGVGKVIKGWDLGVATMRKGEKAILTCKPEYAYGASGSPPKIPPNSTLNFEVELLSWEEKGKENVTDDGLVQKLVLFESGGYENPREGASLEVKIKGMIDEGKGEGKVFLDKSDYKIDLEDPELPEGLEEGLLKMTKGEHAKIFVDSKYGYGEKGNKALKVPANAKLVYDVTVTNLTNAKATWELTKGEKLQLGQKRKALGNTFFKRGDLRRAYKKWDNVSSLFQAGDKDFEPEEKKELAKLKATCSANMAALRLKEKNFTAVIDLATKALQDEADNTKVLLRRATAYAHLKQNDEASEDLKKLLSLDGKNDEAIALKKAVDARIAKDKEKQRKLYGGFFNKVELVDAKEVEAAKSKMPNLDGPDSSDDEDMKSAKPKIEEAEEPKKEEPKKEEEKPKEEPAVEIKKDETVANKSNKKEKSKGKGADVPEKPAEAQSPPAGNGQAAPKKGSAKKKEGKKGGSKKKGKTQE